MASNGNDLPINSSEDGNCSDCKNLNFDTDEPFKDEVVYQNKENTTGIVNETRQIARTYVIVSHIAFVIITPLLLFVGGGTYIVRKYSLPPWLNIALIITGIFVMLFSLIHYLLRLLHLYGKDKGKNDEYRKYKTDPKDYDY